MTADSDKQIFLKTGRKDIFFVNILKVITNHKNMQAIWKPSQQRMANSELTRYINYISEKYQLNIKNYQQLHQFSVQQPETFWSSLIDFFDIIHSKPANTAFLQREHMIDTQWFPGMKLNFAENLLRCRDDKTALIFENEHGKKTSLSYYELYTQVAQLQQKMQQAGIESGDRVAGFLPNIPETIIAMLATTAIGAIWSSTSPDFGTNGVIDRFGQIKPKLLFATDGYYYNGKTYSTLQKLSEIADQLPDLKKVIIIPFTQTLKKEKLTTIKNPEIWSQWLQSAQAEKPIEFQPVDFDHPLYILYSSGTTGQPKCIVHRTGGILLQHMKELALHSNLKPDNRLFYFTTCGWMMWNWMVSGLAIGATLVLYDGSPAYPDSNRLFDLIDKYRISHFGTSAKWLSAIEKNNLKPQNSHQLKTLDTIFSTGSPLLPEQYEYVYTNIKSDVCLSSISGGTDICSCFALGNPNLPVYKGQLQCIGLGLQVEILDPQGNSIKEQPGELSCTQPFPCMPLSFWNDPDKKKYKSAYFSQYDKIWCHSDRAELTRQNGLIIYGRSDTTLNPGGVRIGTAEIYRQVEKIGEIKDSVVIGQNWKDDVRIVLFVVLKEPHKLSEKITEKIRTTIRQNTTPRHVPAVILMVPDIPRTISGKTVELAVKHAVHNQSIKNTDALANPEALEHFKNRIELQQ